MKNVISVFLLGLFLAGCNLLSGSTEIGETDEVNQQDQTADTSAGGEAIDVETITLSAVGDYEGTGSATRHSKDGLFVHTVMTDLGDPAEGKFYEGWLVRQSPLSVVSTGKLDVGENGYVLNFSSENDLYDHIQVVVTEETLAQGLDGKPEAHVLEGSF